MSFLFTFPRATRDDDDAPEDLEAWLTGQGEPFEPDDVAGLRLRALPVVLTSDVEGLRAEVDPSPQVPLPRLIGLLFDLALWLGTDMHLGQLPIDRAVAWLRLADEQDRNRIAQAISRAGPRTDEVLTGLWRVLRALGRNHDLRWDPTALAIVEVRIWSDGEEITAAEATEETDPGALITFRVHDGLHIFAWRWLAETWPALTN